jgi:hypothetical protein
VESTSGLAEFKTLDLFLTNGVLRLSAAEVVETNDFLPAIGNSSRETESNDDT